MQAFVEEGPKRGAEDGQCSLTLFITMQFHDLTYVTDTASFSLLCLLLLAFSL